jgi:CRISPR-associated protein (TIGR02710 family)
MIISLGGSPEPVIVSINHHHPDVVCFLASQQTIELVSKVKERLDYQLADRKVLAQDPNDLLVCFKDALACWNVMIQHGVASNEVLIDFTGGTKVMSSALVLLGIQKGCSFSYIGGTERTKGGVGTVVTGHEQVFEGANPWMALAIGEEQQAISYFNQLRFSAAYDTFKNAQAQVQHIHRRLSMLFSRLANLSQAYQLWEAFRHREAYASLQAAYDELVTYADISGDQRLGPLLLDIQPNVEFLKEMASQSQGFRWPCRAYTLDLIANGQRRARVGNFDEAVLRLYRALEMQAQSQLKAHHGINTSEVQPEQVPQVLRDCFVRRHSDKNGTLALPLEASYLLLGALSDPIGERFQQRQKQFKGVQSSRNQSWLAHGTSVVSEQAYASLHELVLTLCDVAAGELPAFPELSSSV